jgi:segregation and condensation protein B
MRTLLARGLVEECGHDEETTATLYRTTSYFLERIGVTSIDELPELAPFLPEMGDLDELEEAMSGTTAAAPAAAGQGTEQSAGHEAGQVDDQASQETV